MNMWMVGYNEGGGDQLNMGDYGFNGRKLRPLMPRPLTTTSSSNTNHNNTSTTGTTTPPPPNCLSRTNIHGNDFFTQCHNLAVSVGVGDQSKSRELNNNNTAGVVVSSSRWNPTPEQLRALEELYRRGTRTPSAEQIQQITAQLRRFGKIEGKNVFYWFQNHKARERQKRRRQMESAAASAQHHLHAFDDPPSFLVEKNTSNNNKDLLGSNRTLVFELEQTKNVWPPSNNNFSTTSSTALAVAEESVSIQRGAAKAAAAAAECSRTDGRLQFDDVELQQQQRRNFMERNATWHMMQQLTCPTATHPPAPSLVSPHLMNTHDLIHNNNHFNFINTSITTTSSNYSMATTSTTVISPTHTDPNLINNRRTHHDLSLFINSPHHNHTENGFIHYLSTHDAQAHANAVESQTLQLFPIRNGDGSSTTTDRNFINQHKEADISASAMNAPSQFFEFLPLKNN